MMAGYLTSTNSDTSPIGLMTASSAGGGNPNFTRGGGPNDATLIGASGEPPMLRGFNPGNPINFAHQSHYLGQSRPLQHTNRKPGLMLGGRGGAGGGLGDHHSHHHPGSSSSPSHLSSSSSLMNFGSPTSLVSKGGSLMPSPPPASLCLIVSVAGDPMVFSETNMDWTKLNIFRTRLCDRLTQTRSCHMANRCLFSHDMVWPRRTPFLPRATSLTLRYIPVWCPRLRWPPVVGYCDSLGKIGWNSADPTWDARRCHLRCTRGDNCPFAHNVEELLFHPEVYKTRSCCLANDDAFDEQIHSGCVALCPWYFCPFAHDVYELRDLRASRQAWHLPPQIVDDLFVARTQDFNELELQIIDFVRRSPSGSFDLYASPDSPLTPIWWRRMPPVIRPVPGSSLESLIPSGDHRNLKFDDLLYVMILSSLLNLLLYPVENFYVPTLLSLQCAVMQSQMGLVGQLDCVSLLQKRQQKLEELELIEAAAAAGFTTKGLLTTPPSSFKGAEQPPSTTTTDGTAVSSPPSSSSSSSSGLVATTAARIKQQKNNRGDATGGRFYGSHHCWIPPSGGGAPSETTSDLSSASPPYFQGTTSASRHSSEWQQPYGSSKGSSNPPYDFGDHTTLADNTTTTKDGTHVLSDPRLLLTGSSTTPGGTNSPTSWKPSDTSNTTSPDILTNYWSSFLEDSQNVDSLFKQNSSPPSQHINNDTTTTTTDNNHQDSNETPTAAAAGAVSTTTTPTTPATEDQTNNSHTNLTTMLENLTSALALMTPPSTTTTTNSSTDDIESADNDLAVLLDFITSPAAAAAMAEWKKSQHKHHK